MNIILVGHSST